MRLALVFPLMFALACGVKAALPKPPLDEPEGKVVAPSSPKAGDAGCCEACP